MAVWCLWFISTKRRCCRRRVPGVLGDRELIWCPVWSEQPWVSPSTQNLLHPAAPHGGLGSVTYWVAFVTSYSCL